MLPFTTEQFLDVFGRYNRAIWPLQVVAYGLGVLVLLVAWPDRQAAVLRLHAGRV